MSKIKKINTTHVFGAINKIEKDPSLRKGRQSSTYDLIFEGKRYPPILVISEANKLNGGEELLLKDFGNNVDFAFKILRDLGFDVLEKKKRDNLSLEERKEAFKDFLQSTSPKDSGKPTSYLQAINNLDELFNEIGKIKGSIYFIEDISILEKFLEDVKVYQKDKSSILFKKPPSYAERGFYSASLAGYIDMIKHFEEIQSYLEDRGVRFSILAFQDALAKVGLSFKPEMATRFTASLLAKPFVLLNGLSGSGKTKLAQAFVQWICKEESQYKIVPVGADWTNREPLLGYPNGLDANEYITPDNGALQLILEANRNENKPYFLILDEMNLSHVERYFADFLSIMESNDVLRLYTGTERKCSEGNIIPKEVSWPRNLFIIGTVNIDETTYMFSPKVLDRANVIEFRLDVADLQMFFDNDQSLNMEILIGEGQSMANSFLEIAQDTYSTKSEEVKSELILFFEELSNVGAEFGYRTVNEVLLLIERLKVLDSGLELNDQIDIAIMQKILPKLHGSRSKISKVLETLMRLCLVDAKDFDINKALLKGIDDSNIKYPISYAKLLRMYANVIANGFTSYAEA